MKTPSLQNRNGGRHLQDSLQTQTWPLLVVKLNWNRTQPSSAQIFLYDGCLIWPDVKKWPFKTSYSPEVVSEIISLLDIQSILCLSLVNQWLEGCARPYKFQHLSVLTSDFGWFSDPRNQCEFRPRTLSPERIKSHRDAYDGPGPRHPSEWELLKAIDKRLAIGENVKNLRVSLAPSLCQSGLTAMQLAELLDWAPKASKLGVLLEIFDCIPQHAPGHVDVETQANVLWEFFGVCSRIFTNVRIHVVGKPSQGLFPTHIQWRAFVNGRLGCNLKALCLTTAMFDDAQLDLAAGDFPQLNRLHASFSLARKLLLGTRSRLESLVVEGFDHLCPIVPSIGDNLTDTDWEEWIPIETMSSLKELTFDHFPVWKPPIEIFAPKLLQLRRFLMVSPYYGATTFWDEHLGDIRKMHWPQVPEDAHLMMKSSKNIRTCGAC